MAFWNNWPWSNFHELNLDWILDKMKKLESSVERVVNSWNGRTGDVTMEAKDVNDLAINAVITSATDPQTMGQAAVKALYDSGARFIVYRSGDSDRVYAIIYAESSKTCTLYDLGVTSFNGRKGAVNLTADDVNTLGIGVATELDANQTPADLGTDELVDLYKDGIRLLIGNTNGNNNYQINDRLWILRNDGSTLEMNLSQKFTRFFALSATEDDFNNYTDSNAGNSYKQGSRIVGSPNIDSDGAFRIIFFNTETGTFGSRKYTPVYSFEGRHGAVTLEDSDLTGHAVTSFNNRKDAVTLSQDDITELGINSVYQFDPGTDPTTQTQDQLKELWDAGYRVLLNPDDSGAYTGLYLLSQSGESYVLDYYDASKNAPVQSVNGKTGAVELSASDVGAVATDGSNAQYLYNIENYTPDTTHPYRIATVYKYRNGTAYTSAIDGVKSWNGRKGTVNLVASDINNLGIRTVGVTTEDFNPSTLTQAELGAYYGDSLRILFAPTGSSGKYNLYFLTKTVSDNTTTYAITLYDPTLGSGSVSSVNGKDGAVTLDATDVGAVAKDGSNGAYLTNLIDYTPDTTNPNRIAVAYKQENGTTYENGVNGVKSWNGMQGVVTYNPTAWKSSSITNATPTGISRNSTKLYVNTALKLAFLNIHITITDSVGSTNATIATFNEIAPLYSTDQTYTTGTTPGRIYTFINTDSTLQIRYGSAGTFSQTYLFPYTDISVG